MWADTMPTKATPDKALPDQPELENPEKTGLMRAEKFEGVGIRRADTGLSSARPEPLVVTGLSPKKAEQSPEKTVAKPKDIKDMTYTELYESLHEKPIEGLTDKEKKKRKREMILSSVFDGISDLANIYWTTQYAPDMHSPNTLAKGTGERWEKLAKNRADNMNAYIRGLQEAKMKDNEYALKLGNLNRQEAKDKADADYKNAMLALEQAKDERDAAKADLDGQLKRNQISKAEYEAKVAEAQAKYADALEHSKIEKNKAAAGASNASAQASRARAKHISDGNWHGTFRGKKYEKKADYDKDVIVAAEEYEIPLEEEQVLERGWNNNPTKTKRVRKSQQQLAAEVEKRDKEEEKGKKDRWSDN